MDWDLEAPGLAYYFRGMQEGAGAAQIRNAPGVLDIVWEWTSLLRSSPREEDLQRIQEHYSNGEPFQGAVRTLVDDEVFEAGGRIDIIGAGRNKVPTLGGQQLPYEEALAQFDWSRFFDEEAGGTLLSAWRDWARANYELILIDSRTGFADVAGVCTMQLPDEVVLCFVLNRQNIDGVARVAAAVRRRRGTDITLRCAPMRTARENTQEEAAARARARKELTGRGGFSAEDVDADFQRLRIRAAPNVPFYETVAPIAEPNARTDQLALDYLRFSIELFDYPTLEIPDLSEEWVAEVLRLLQPRDVTTDYVLKLRSTEPSLAIEEITQLLRTAIANDMDGPIDEPYIAALVDVATQIARNADVQFHAAHIFSDTVDLLRILADSAPKRWQMSFALQVMSYVEYLGHFLEYEEQILLLDEADAIFGTESREGVPLLRLANRRRVARVHLQLEHVEAARSAVNEIRSIIDESFSTLPLAQRPEEAIVAEVESYLLRGDLAAEEQRGDRALHQFNRGLALYHQFEARGKPELMRLRYDLHSRLARLNSSHHDVHIAAEHALQALEWAGSSTSFVVQFIELAGAIVKADDPELAVDFVQRGLASGDHRGFSGTDSRSSVFSNFYGRHARQTARLLRRADELIQLTGRSERRDERAMARRALIETIMRTVVNLERRGMRTDNDFLEVYQDIIDHLETQTGYEETARDELKSLIPKLREALRPRPRRLQGLE